jgi:hypothetical protein
MKRILFLLAVYLLANQIILIAQEEKTIFDCKIGITFSSFGNNHVFRFNELLGAASYSGENSNTIGICYVYGLNKWLETETCLEYSWHNIIINPNLPPNMDNSPRKANFSLINIPVTLRANFLRYLFLNGGLILDIDASKNFPIDSQTGIGAILGVAIKYDFNFGVSAFINPYTKVHSLIPFSFENYHQRLWENGLRIGITYDLRTMK